MTISYGMTHEARHNNSDINMPILTPAERAFLDVFLHEATTAPFFNGPATKALYGIGVAYSDISYIAWAYEQDVARTDFGWGHAAAVGPPLPWPDRVSVLRRDAEIRHLSQQRHTAAGTPNAS